MPFLCIIPFNSARINPPTCFRELWFAFCLFLQPHGPLFHSVPYPTLEYGRMELLSFLPMFIISCFTSSAPLYLLVLQPVLFVCTSILFWLAWPTSIHLLWLGICILQEVLPETPGLGQAALPTRCCLH